MTTRSTREVGIQGEDVAEKFLINTGYYIILRNWYCYAGEIDLVVANNDRGLVFVEVKFSRNYKRLLPEEMFTENKKRRLRRSINNYLSKNMVYDYSVDLICVYYTGSSGSYGVKHYTDVF